MIFLCKTCGTEVANKTSIPDWVENQYDGDKLLMECYRTIRDLQDQQAMEDRFSDKTLSSIQNYLLKRGYKIV